MTSTSESVPQLASRAITRAAVVTHGQAQTIGPALARLATVAREAGVELVLGAEEVEKHGLDPGSAKDNDVDLAVVLGGDGTMLRALRAVPRSVSRLSGRQRALHPVGAAALRVRPNGLALAGGVARARLLERQVHQVFKIGARPLESGGFGVGEVIRDDVDPRRKRLEARRSGMERGYRHGGVIGRC